MWLQGFTEMGARVDGNRYWAAAGLLLLLAGCAGAPPPAVAPVEGDDAVAVREIPPRAQTLYEQAVSAMAAGDLVDAQLRFEAFVLEYPDYPGAHVNLAIIHARNGDDQAAEGSLADALILDPEYAPALNQLGMLLRRQGKFDAAEDAYLKAVTADPGYALAHYNLGVLNELYLQRLDVALQHFEIFQSLNGEDEQVGKWIADLQRRLQDSQRTANRTE
jgi:tetratricopeptide (TPR) repeat protein